MDNKQKALVASATLVAVVADGMAVSADSGGGYNARSDN